jgi:hypothetical protein
MQAQRGAEARNMVLVGHNDLSRRSAAGAEADFNGLGDGGEGLALQQWPDGRRILYLAHEAPQRCVSIIDVTSVAPRHPGRDESGHHRDRPTARQ